MGKIFSLSKIGAFFRGYFGKNSSKSESVITDNVIVLAERVSKKTSQKVTSPQIEAYYKRYGNCTKPIQKPKVIKDNTKKTSVLGEELEAEAQAHDKAKFIDVSQEALNSLKQNFERKRDNVKEIILKEADLHLSDFIKSVKTMKTPEELALVLRSYTNEAEINLDKRYNEAIQKFLKTKVISLKDQQKIHKGNIRISNTYLELLKSVTEPTKDANAIAIEDYLKTRFGMDYVHLENIDEAKRVLKAIMLAQKYKLPIPKNIIISPFTPISASGVNCPHSAQEFTVVLKSVKEDNSMKELAYTKLKSSQIQELAKQLREEDCHWFSTDDELQRYVHEFCHSSQFMELLLPHKWNPIPKKFEGTIRNLGIYAQTSRREVGAELKTKQILRSLNKEEKELLDYLE